MLKKAYRYNDETVFYFDGHDNKYIAHGGSLAWRLNNPCLLTSHSLDRIKYKAIGAHHQFAIFPDPRIGKEAFRAWLHSPKYFKSSLGKIAKHYLSDNPENYLKRLCELTGFSSKTKLKSLSKANVEKLLNAVQELADFHVDKSRPFILLPKITAKFHSKDHRIESYLIGYEIILDKKEAIQWVEAHKLDAVIVHRGDAEIYLRSRPGHHFNQIHFKQEEYGADNEFKDALRDVGTQRIGQCIWGFVNGISNSAAQALQSTNLISNHANGEKVWSLVNDAKFLGNLIEAAVQKLNYRSEVIKYGVHFLKFLIDQSNQNPSKPPIVIFAHSQGALIIDLSLNGLTPEERSRIHVHTLGGAAFISPSKANPNSHNYFSVADPIPRISTPDFTMFLLRLYEGKKLGHMPLQLLDHLIQEDIDVYLDTQDPTALEEFRKQRRVAYENMLQQAQNISILDENVSGFWEHAFAIPCYQAIVEKVINQYRQKSLR